MTITAVVLGLVVAAVAALVVVGGQDDDRSRLQQAVALAPDDARRVLWTDWRGVRAELGLELDTDTTGEGVQELLDLGYDADLTSTTVLGSSSLTMQEVFGFSPATLEWELFTQAEAGASLVMKLGAGVTTDDVADSLRALGYLQDDGGLWSSNSGVVPVTAEVTPELAFISLDADAGIVRASDTSAGVALVSEAGDGDGAGPVPDGVLAAAGTALSAAVYTGDEVCGSLAMANADPDEQEAGEALVAQAGEVNPLTGFVIAAESGGGVRVVMSFETDEQARTNADTRALLAAGPAPGQGGDFADRFAVAEVTARDAVVTLDLDPVDGAYVVSDLSTGPLLFATC